jgi:hypothetical protein
MTSQYFHEIDFDALTIEKPPSSPLYVHLAKFPIDEIPECRIGFSGGDKDKDERRPLISTPIAKKKKRKGKRLSRNKQADIRKRRESNARRQLPLETVVGRPTLFYAMDSADSSGSETVVGGSTLCYAMDPAYSSGMSAGVKEDN